MKVSVDVYTKDLDAAFSAYKKATEDGGLDVRLSSNHDYDTNEVQNFNLMFDIDHAAEVNSFLDDGPFAKDPDDL